MPLLMDKRKHRRLLILLCILLLYYTKKSPRHRLRRIDLLPVLQSPHKKLLDNRNDDSYILAFGLDVASFDILLCHFVDFLPRLEPPGRPRQLSNTSILALTLQHLTTPAYHRELSQIYGTTPATTS